MRRRFAWGLALVAAILPLVGAIEGAHAETLAPLLSACAERQTWTFSTALDEAFRSGSIGLAASGDCETVYNPVHGPGTAAAMPPEPLVLVQNTESMPYQGSCVVATYSYAYDAAAGVYNGSGLLVGGTVAVASAGRTDMFVELAPLTPCAEASATGAAEAVSPGATTTQ